MVVKLLERTSRVTYIRQMKIESQEWMSDQQKRKRVQEHGCITLLAAILHERKLS